MQRATIIERLQRYIAQDILAGKDIGLNETTPLLEWGIINSLQMIKLMNFIDQEFTVDIPPDKLMAEYFTTISSIASLVMEQMPVQP